MQINCQRVANGVWHLISRLPSCFSMICVLKIPGPQPFARKGTSLAALVMRLPKRSKRHVMRLPDCPAARAAGGLGRSQRAGQVSAARHLPWHVTAVCG